MSAKLNAALVASLIVLSGQALAQSGGCGSGGSSGSGAAGGSAGGSGSNGAVASPSGGNNQLRHAGERCQRQHGNPIAFLHEHLVKDPILRSVAGRCGRNYVPEQYEHGRNGESTLIAWQPPGTPVENLR